MQQNLLLLNLQLSTILEPLSICIPFPDWWLVQALFCTGQNQEEETKNIKREAKRDCYNSFEASPQSLDCCWSVAKSCLTLYDPMNCSTPGFPVLHYLPEFAQTHVHWVGDAIQPSHPLLPSSPPAFNLSQNQGLFQWVSSLHQVAKVLELQLQHQSFQWIFRVDFLYDWLVWSPCSPRDSQESSPAPQFECINSSVLSLLYGPTLTSGSVCLNKRSVCLSCDLSV